MHLLLLYLRSGFIQSSLTGLENSRESSTIMKSIRIELMRIDFSLHINADSHSSGTHENLIKILIPLVEGEE